MNLLLYFVLNMSIYGSIVALAVFAASKIKIIPRRIVSFLWILPAIRLLFPFYLSLGFSLFDLEFMKPPKEVTLYDGPISNITILNRVDLAETYYPMTFKASAEEKFFTVAGAVYFIIAVALLISFAILYFTTCKELSSAKHMRDNIYVSDSLLSPAAVGIIKPKIILPAYLVEDVNEFIIIHESMHIRRHDNLKRMIAVIICCIHWFNPLIWLFLGSFLSNLELACDEDVLSKCGEEKKKEYAMSIVGCEEKKTVFISSFGGAKTRVRISNILSYKKLSLFSSVALLVFSVLSAIVLLTN